MRPLIRLNLNPQIRETVPALGLLLNTFGPYCAFSEEPIFDVAVPWNRASGQALPASIPPGDSWEAILLTSPATFTAWQRHRDRNLADLMMPDVDLTFRLLDSPFTYDLETVKVTYLNDIGEPDGESETRPLAIVRGATDRARATIDLFALNSDYFAADKRELTIPRSTYLSREDPRIFLRTDTWARAAQAADWIAEVNPNARPMLLDQVRAIVGGTGFWSVWATVLWRRFQDRDLVSRVLMEPRETAEKFATMKATSGKTPPESPGPGPHNVFPGTRPDWMF